MGLEKCLNTEVGVSGVDFKRGISGGELKRLTTAEMTGGCVGIHNPDT